MLWIKLFPCLGYFPVLGEIPIALVDHVRNALDLAAGVVPGYDHDRTLYRHHQVVREYHQILPYGKEARRVILRTLLRTVRTMDNPTDMINAALEALIKQRYEMPALSTLDCLTGRVRTLVYKRICQMVQHRMSAVSAGVITSALIGCQDLYFGLIFNSAHETDSARKLARYTNMANRSFGIV